MRAARLIQIVLVTFVPIAALFRWLFGSISGLLVTVIVLWHYERWQGLSKPFNFDGLLLWFATQHGDVKLALVAMLLTLVGFMAAFWTASITWARQKELELRIEASKAIHTRFQRVLRLVNSLDSYLHVLRNSIAAAEPLLPGPSATLHLGFVNSRAENFAKDRQELYAAMLDVYALTSEFSIIFANVIGVEKDIKRASRAVVVAQEQLAEFWAPHVAPTDPNFAQSFLSQCNLTSTQAAQNQCVQAREYASALSGKASGKLTAAIIRPNLLAVLAFLRHRHVIGRLFSLKNLD